MPETAKRIEEALVILDAGMSAFLVISIMCIAHAVNASVHTFI